MSGDDEPAARDRSRSRHRERRSHRSRSPQGVKRRASRSPQERRRRSPQPELRRRSRSRSRGGYDDRDSRRHRTPPGVRNRSPPRRSYGRRSPSLSPPPRGGATRSPPRHAGGRWGPPSSSDRRGPPPQQMLSDVPPEVGSIHHARVVSVRPFGAFVDLPGYRKQALIHSSQISEEIQFGREEEDEMKVKAMEYFVPRGEQVWVKVLEVRQEGPGPQGIKLAASMRAVSQEDGRDLDPDNALAMTGRGGPGGGGGGGGGGSGRGRDSDEPPELYSIHKAAVQQVRPFGVFVKLEGYHKYGLVHFSQISDHLSFTREDADDVKMKEIGEIMAVGDPVFVKVVDITQDDRGPKIGCSIKHVSQSDGTDLDPSNSKYRPRGGEGGSHQGQKPIGATAGVAHDGAVDWGHLKADVVQYGTGGPQYEILAGGDSDEERRQRRGGPGGGGGGSGGPPGAPPPHRPPPPGMASGANMAPMPSRGRGGGAVLPAWMTSGGGGGGGAAPGSTAPPSGAVQDFTGLGVTSTAQALAILEAAAKAKKEKRKKHKKDKKGKKEKHGKKEKRSKHKKEKRSSRRGSDSDSGSGSGSE